ncbi:sulfatase-modifying factor protein [Candidatus Termititenax persephonae]|uniref:Sulfatase-modifying factor protein n=1 Tax=Candidatus Termititenax persephonae TaxID=2218525 RepID=A0A388TI52_9BACT|nr:sulfatase-modifying factor protein [Candidatus Termititenax persephonae]
MTNNYNDTYEGIGSGQPLSAEKMTAALNLMEKVANKVETGTLSSGNTSAQYPSAKVVWDSLKEAETRIVQNAAVGFEVTANKVTAAAWAANKDNDVKYPSCAALTELLHSSDLERTANRVDKIMLAEAANDKYPTAKAVYDLLTLFEPLSLTMNEDKFVRLTKSGRDFWIAKHETTQGEFEAVMGYNQSNNKGGDYPVETVSWYEAVQYCLRLTLESGDVSAGVKEQVRGYCVDLGGYAGQQWDNNTSMNFYDAVLKTEAYNNTLASSLPGCYRLPTEEEWEYACRGGTTTAYIWGDSWNATEMSKYGWWSNNSGGTTHAVGQKEANAYGLYDVLGNVWEWCSSQYNNSTNTYSYWDGSKYVNHPSPNRVLRGGAYVIYYSDYFASSYRITNIPHFRYFSYGFRLARTV